MKLFQLTFLALFFFSVFFSHAQKTEIQFLSGTGSDKTINWDFFCTEGHNSGKWTQIPVPSNWELQGFGTYNYGHGNWYVQIRFSGPQGMEKQAGQHCFRRFDD